MFYVVNTNRDYCKHIVNKLAFLTILRAVQGKKKESAFQDKLLSVNQLDQVVRRNSVYLLCSMAACAAARRAIGTRKGEQDT